MLGHLGCEFPAGDSSLVVAYGQVLAIGREAGQPVMRVWDYSKSFPEVGAALPEGAPGPRVYPALVVGTTLYRVAEQDLEAYSLVPTDRNQSRATEPPKTGSSPLPAGQRIAVPPVPYDAGILVARETAAELTVELVALDSRLRERPVASYPGKVAFLVGDGRASWLGINEGSSHSTSLFASRWPGRPFEPLDTSCLGGTPLPGQPVPVMLGGRLYFVAGSPAGLWQALPPPHGRVLSFGLLAHGTLPRQMAGAATRDREYVLVVMPDGQPHRYWLHRGRAEGHAPAGVQHVPAWRDGALPALVWDGDGSALVPRPNGVLDLLSGTDGAAGAPLALDFPGDQPLTAFAVAGDRLFAVSAGGHVIMRDL